MPRDRRAARQLPIPVALFTDSTVSNGQRIAIILVGCGVVLSMPLWHGPCYPVSVFGFFFDTLPIPFFVPPGFIGY